MSEQLAQEVEKRWAEMDEEARTTGYVTMPRPNGGSYRITRDLWEDGIGWRAAIRETLKGGVR